VRLVTFLLSFLLASAFSAQVQTIPDPSKDPVYFCPMDRDIRSNTPGKCSRCGMNLVAGVPDPVEYHLDLTVTPRSPKPGEKAHLKFDVHDPWKSNPVKKFNIVHEKLFHAFIVSEDLQVFVHDHPVWLNDAFHYDMTFPRAGMYRVLGDFYPEGATPQLISKTIYVAGNSPPVPPLREDYSPKAGQNIKVELALGSGTPVAGHNTPMRFKISPGDGLEKYLGAWGHMLAASDDLIDMMHTHPFIADGSPEISSISPFRGLARTEFGFNFNARAL
jgi:hypothetical protein